MCSLPVERCSLWAPNNCVKPPPATVVTVILLVLHILVKALLEEVQLEVRKPSPVKLGKGQQAGKSASMEQDMSAQDMTAVILTSLGRSSVLMPHHYGVQPVQGCLSPV